LPPKDKIKLVTVVKPAFFEVFPEQIFLMVCCGTPLTFAISSKEKPPASFSAKMYTLALSKNVSIFDYLIFKFNNFAPNLNCQKSNLGIDFQLAINYNSIKKHGGFLK
jgi:hypothetical protein